MKNRDILEEMEGLLKNEWSDALYLKICRDAILKKSKVISYPWREVARLFHLGFPLSESSRKKAQKAVESLAWVIDVLTLNNDTGYSRITFLDVLTVTDEGVEFSISDKFYERLQKGKWWWDE